MKKPVLGVVGRTPLHVDVKSLVISRLELQANSGGGKSYGLRRFAEITHPLIHQIILDVEDELYTLREKFNYLLVREGGDAVPSIRSAKLLARRIMELETSAIIGLHELKRHERFAFMRVFLEQLMSLPKRLYHPTLVVIDEAHMFCPEKEKAESTSAVVDLMTRGRKRGLCGMLATQRIAKLNKDALAECNNKLIGRTGLDLDIKRCADELGLTLKEAKKILPRLKPGEFFAFGPAISPEVVRMKVGKVVTKHPEPGEPQPPVPAPKKVLKRVLRELEDLPQEAAQEIKDLAQAKQEVASLRRELSKAKNRSEYCVDAMTLEKAREEGYAKAEEWWQKVNGKALEELFRLSAIVEELVGPNISDHFQMVVNQMRDHRAIMMNNFKEMKVSVQAVRKLLGDKPKGRPPIVQKKNTTHVVDKAINVALQQAKTVKDRATSVGFVETETPDLTFITGGARRMVEVLVQTHPGRVTKSQWAALANLKPTSGTFNTYMSRIRTAGFIEKDGKYFCASSRALEEFSDHVLPQAHSPEEKLTRWCQTKLLSGTPSKMLQLVYAHHPGEITKQEIGETLGMTPTSGTFNTYISRLRSNELIVVRGEEISLGKEFTD